MKWKTNYKDRECRIITKFLWFPVTIKGETRWLERASIKQKFYIGDSWSMWWNDSWALSPLDQIYQDWLNEHPDSKHYSNG